MGLKLLFILFFISFAINGQSVPQNSGGKLLPEQSCYDVTFYDISLTVDPAEKAIAGTTIIKASTAKTFSKIIIDLDNSLEITDLRFETINNNLKSTYTHSQNKILITLNQEIKEGQNFSVTISYQGIPIVAKRPPWDDGFIWSKNAEGKDWITLTCQGGGGDIWFACKDHPLDEPDSVATHFTIPKQLVCISSGKLIGWKENGDGTKTWNWFTSTPINNYNVSLYIGPYIPIEYDYTSTAQSKIPFTVWVLPESLEKAKAHAPQFLNHMKINEELCGPYPFRADKYSVVETKHLGMEHQTAIAYGYGWKDDPNFPIDWLHHHEFSHEWWGNLVTVKDWSDFWIHEGIGLYMQPLYLEKTVGKDAYINYLLKYKRMKNAQPVAPRAELTEEEAYAGDIYNKGAWFVHTLRYFIGDESFFKLLRRWAYPTEEMEKITDGRQCRNANTDEFLGIAEKISGKKLDWFWEVYLRRTKLPILNYMLDGNKITLWWETENNINFPLPIEIKVAREIKKVEMIDGKGTITIPTNEAYVIDPSEWILMDKLKQ